MFKETLGLIKISARLLGPKNPVAGRPMLVCQSITAVRVAGPKYPVGSEIARYLFVIKNCCKDETSSPDIETDRFLEKTEGVSSAAYTCMTNNAYIENKKIALIRFFTSILYKKIEKIVIAKIKSYGLTLKK